MKTSESTARGLTLLEVVLALSILAGSFVLLTQLVSIGVHAASNGRNLTRAQLLAESIMSEISAGILPAESLNDVRVGADPEWTVSAIVQNSPHPGIVQITLITQHITDTKGRSRFLLTRWLRDPSLEIPTDDEADSDSPSDDDATSSSSGNSLSNNQGSTTNNNTSTNAGRSDVPATGTNRPGDDRRATPPGGNR